MLLLPLKHVGNFDKLQMFIARRLSQDREVARFPGSWGARVALVSLVYRASAPSDVESMRGALWILRLRSA